MARIIGIANQKGGVAKTTTAVNLAACLALADQRTLLIDLDPQGNATSGVGIDKNSVDHTIYDVLTGGLPLTEAIYETGIPHLSAVPANIDLSGAQVELLHVEGREYLVRNAIQTVRDSYAFIILDCPPSLGIITLNAMAAAETILIPIQCEYYALEGISQLLETIELARTHLNPTLGIEGVLLTMFDSRTNLATQVANEVREFFGDQVYQTVIPRNVRLSEAPSFGKPIALYDLNSAGSKAYINLTREVIHGRTQSTR